LICYAFIFPFFFTSCASVDRARTGIHPPEGAFYVARNIFQQGEYGKECHSSTIIETGDGDLLAAWWSGSFEGSADVAIKVARLRGDGGSWERAETAADIPDRFEGNPVLFYGADNILWLFFVVSEIDDKSKVQIMLRESRDQGRSWERVRKFVTYPGVRTRNHPIIMGNDTIFFPLHDHLTGRSVFMVSANNGLTWEHRGSVSSVTDNIQPTVIYRGDGTLYALMRTWNEDPAKRFLWQSESADYGRTWTVPTPSSIPTVDSAVEMIRLHNGHVVLAYNDGKGRERTPLTLALSFDEGRTWSYKRDIESGAGSFSYPSLVQSRDGHIHVTYSYNRKFIKHVEVNESWIMANEGIK
jgi:predicted neuraminidase